MVSRRGRWGLFMWPADRWSAVPTTRMSLLCPRALAPRIPNSAKESNTISAPIRLSPPAANHHERPNHYQNENTERQHKGHNFQNPRVLKGLLRALLFGFHEQREFLVERNESFNFFLQLERKPLRCQRPPGCGKFSQTVRIRRLQPAMTPER